MISTKGRYALRLMIDLATQDPTSYIPLKDIATRQGISEKYMEIIIKALVKEKLITGMRGKGGGYKLLKKPSEYLVGEILESAGEQLSPVACLLPGADICARESVCPTLSMWQQYDKLSHDFFYGISLTELLNN